MYLFPFIFSFILFQERGYVAFVDEWKEDSTDPEKAVREVFHAIGILPPTHVYSKNKSLFLFATIFACSI